MVLRKRFIASLSTGLLPLLSASFSHALIVQPVQVKSALGEPFYAEVSLSDLGSIQLQDLSVGVASAQELADLGIKPGTYAGSLSFNVQTLPNDRGIIIIRGRQPTTEPFVEFVLRIKNGQNTRLQRVSAMIDPADNNKKIIALQNAADMPPMSAAPVRSSASNSVSLATSSTPIFDVPVNLSSDVTSKLSRSTERSLNVINAMPPDMPRAQLSNVQDIRLKPADSKQEIEVSTVAKKNQPQHVVKNNESLWKIAKRLEPQLNQPVGQIMQRIRNLNEDAFIAGDPNQLKRGATLVLPEREQNTSLVAAAPTAAPIKKIPKTPTVASTVPINRSGRLPKAELTLVAPNVQGSTQGNSNTGQNIGIQPLPREIVLKIGQERRKTVLMQHEVSELDAQLALNDKKIAMLNAKLAQMEQQLKTRNQAKKLPAQKQQMQALPPKKVANLMLPAVAFTSMTLLGFTPTLARAAEGDASGGIPMWMMIVAAIVIIGGIAAFVIKGKDKRPVRGKSKRPVTKRPAPAATTKEQTTPTRPVIPAPAAPVPVARPVAQPVITDVLQEVQSYIERDRYAQAVGLLKDAIAKTPERVDLQVKLLEVYALQNDIDGFEKQFNQVATFNQPEVLQHAEKMRMLLQPKSDNDFKPVDDLSFDFESSKPAGTDNNVIEFDADAESHSSDAAQNKAYSPADQSLDDLEAEFGFGQDLNNANANPALDQTNADFNLDEFESKKPASSDTPVDLEFDLNDSFILQDAKPDISPLHFDNEASHAETAKAPVQSTPAAAQANLDNIDSLDVADTNWAEGFDDQDFNIGSTPAAAKVAASTVALTPADSSADPEDFLAREFPFLVNLDVQQTNLELAESYINLGERASARELLDEVINQGNPQQQAQAQHLMQKLAS